MEPLSVVPNPDPRGLKHGITTGRPDLASAYGRSASQLRDSTGFSINAVLIGHQFRRRQQLMLPGPAIKGLDAEIGVFYAIIN